MHPSLKPLLAGGKVIVTDGAWGTQMQARGLPIGAPPDLWNLSHPERVEEVARAYVEAGSRIILTNTFGASRTMLERHGQAGRAADINREGARISRRAAGDKAQVFASMGPCGKMLLTEEISAEELLDAFSEQAHALFEGGAQGLVVETMADPDEAAIAVTAAKHTGLPVVACMVFDTGPDHDRTMMGTTIADAVQALTDAGADVIGSNCGRGIADYVALAGKLRAATDLPLWLKPNAGNPEMVEGKAVYRTLPEDFAAAAPALVKAGVAFLGGCCGTSPDFIRALLKAV